MLCGEDDCASIVQRGQSLQQPSLTHREDPSSAAKMFAATAVLLMVSIVLCNADSDIDAGRLYDDLINGYNPLIRPVANNSDQLTVKLSLRLSQLVEVNMKNQIMVVKVGVDQEWKDHKLKWDPDEYGGVTKLHVPAEQIWLPDLVMYNNADGNYVVTIMTKAVLHYDGTVVWKPPAIFKSACAIDVEYFPFDEQTCFLKFGSWTYDGYTVDLKHKDQVEGQAIVPKGMDLSEFYLSVEWDVMSVPAIRKERFYSCCEQPYPDVTFNITVRRKTLFYTVNLILPCVVISFMSVLVFYLPCQSNEKISLSISIVLSLGVFFLLLAEIIPPTSLNVPLLGRYLIFTNVLVTVSVGVTIIVLNVNYRSPSTHKMSPWVRKVFLRILPRVLCMRRPDDRQAENSFSKALEPGLLIIASVAGNDLPAKGVGTDGEGNSCRLAKQETQSSADTSFPSPPPYDATDEKTASDRRREEVDHAVLSMKFIAQHMDNVDDFQAIEDDWTYVALVLDRLFLWLFLVACIVGTLLIIFQAPSLYDTSAPIDILYSKVGRKMRHLQQLLLSACLRVQDVPSAAISQLNLLLAQCNRLLCHYILCCYTV